MSAHNTTRSWWRGPDVWTPWDVIWVRTGAGCAVFGLLGQILPSMGYQLIKLQRVGNAAPAVASGVMWVGIFLIVYVVFLKGKLFRVVLGAAALAVLGFIGILMLGWMQSRRFQSPPQFAQQPMYQPQSGATPPVPHYVPQSPGGPSGPPGAHGGPGWRPGTPPPRITKEDLIARYGESRVVTIIFKNTNGIDVGKTVGERIKGLPSASKPNTWSSSTNRDGTGQLLAAPCDNAADFAKALDVGDVSQAFTPQLQVTVTLDAEKCIKAK